MTLLQAAGLCAVWLVVSIITAIAVGALIRAGSGEGE